VWVFRENSIKEIWFSKSPQFAYAPRIGVVVVTIISTELASFQDSQVPVE